MPPEEYSDIFYKGPAYALVIGISEYRYGRPAGQELDPKHFTNLKLASKDAEDFAAFLKSYGFIEYNVERLLNEQATRDGIIDELDKLRRRCKQSETENPLVIVYFSGHGMADDEDRSYLIPYDAERDRLRATAFLNKNFNDHLSELKTTRLVVFLDACHAGAMGMESVKEGLQQYAYKDLGEGTGRYLIASCGPGQKSYEGGANGIFTGHLLELLKCETDDFDEETVDIFNLYPVLRKKVMETARKKHGMDQEPISDIKAATGIILAINKRVRDRRIQKDKKAQEDKKKLLETICDAIQKSESRQKPIITLKLRVYFDEGEKVAGYDEFYALFDVFLGDYDPNDKEQVKECCFLLVKLHEKLTASRQSKEPDSHQPREPIDKSKEPDSHQPREPIDKFVDAVENKALGSERPTTLRSMAPAGAPAGAPARNQPPSRRLFSNEDREYILETIITKLAYYKEARTLIDVLSQPLSEADFATKLHGVQSKKMNDPALRDTLDEIVERFRERWDKAEEVVSKTLSDLMIEKGKE